MHVFGPFEQYPLSASRSYTPPVASIEMYHDVQTTLGLERAVVVQPSVYGPNNRIVLETLDAIGRERARAVVVVPTEVTASQLRSMAERGACGVRFNMVFGNGPPLDALGELAQKLQPVNWHIELYCHSAQIIDLEPVIMRVGVPVVFDHMGGVLTTEGGEKSEAFAALVRLLKSGSWVKLSGYRSSRGYPYDDLTAMARALIAAAPTQCVWGTDWPHPGLGATERVPDDGQLLDLLGMWAPEASERRAILVDNPARLYGF